MSKEYRFYRFVYRLVAWIFYSILGLRVTGRENVPDGAAVVCSPHASLLDPFYLAIGLGIKHHIHFMAKKELFQIKGIGRLVRRLGAFPVDRKNTDVTAIKTAMQYLRSGEKIGIFPEGTRVAQDDAVAAKAGAVRIADRSKVPVLPVYLQRTKRLFGKVKMVIGQPYYVCDGSRRLTGDDYRIKAGELMEQIKRLGDGL